MRRAKTPSPRRVGPPIGSPPQKPLSQTCKLPILPRQSAEVVSPGKLSKSQNALPEFAFAAKTASSVARCSTSCSKKRSNAESAILLKEFFETIMTGHPNQKIEENDTTSTLSGLASVGPKQRGEIYAINKLLREAEQQKFSNFLDSQCTPQSSKDSTWSDESDSDNSCFDTAGNRRSKTGKSSKCRALVTATNIAATMKSPSSSTKSTKSRKKSAPGGTFGAV